MEKIAWLVLTLVTLVAAIMAQRRPRALGVGRVALGVYYVLAGALVNGLYLATGDTFSTFADAAHFSFVRDTWRSLVAPHYLFFIGLLIVFEASVGLLVLSGGRRAEAGMIGILGMQAGLLVFGWIITANAVVMLVAVSLLLRAQHRRNRAIGRPDDSDRMKSEAASKRQHV